MFKSSTLNGLPKGMTLFFSDIADCFTFTATHIQGSATKSALKAKMTKGPTSSQKGKIDKHCDNHPTSMSHNTKDCYMNCQKKEDKDQVKKKEKERGKQKESGHKAKHVPSSSTNLSDFDASGNKSAAYGLASTSSKLLSINRALMTCIQACISESESKSLSISNDILLDSGA